VKGQWLWLEPYWLTWNGYHVYNTGNNGDDSWNADLRGRGTSVGIVSLVTRGEAMAACEEHAERAAVERREQGNGHYAPLTLAYTFRFGPWVLDIGTTPSDGWTVEMTSEACSQPQRLYFSSESAAREYARRFGS
jgi:hypothetical protein